MLDNQDFLGLPFLNLVLCCKTSVLYLLLLSSVFGKDAESDVAGDTSGDFKKLLIGCLQANRPEGQEFDRNKAKQDAQGSWRISY